MEAFFDTQYEQHLRPASQTRHGDFPFIGGKSRLVTVGEALYPSAPVIPCEVRCLGTQTKPTPEPLAEGSSEHTDICIISSLLIILHAFWVNEIIHLKCQAKPSVVWDLVIGGWGFG